MISHNFSGGVFKRMLAKSWQKPPLGSPQLFYNSIKANAGVSTDDNGRLVPGHTRILLILLS